MRGGSSAADGGRWLVAAAMLVTSTASAAPPRSLSILLTDEFAIDSFLHEIPSARSYGALLENVVQPAIYSIEESAGFSDVDPDKVSIYGDSVLWTQWYLDEFDLTDPFFSGSAALTVPFGFVSRLSMPYREAPTVLRGGGVRWHSAPIEEGTTIIGTSGLLGSTGDVWPGAVPIMNSISGLHIRDRLTPPPSERRHEPWAYRLHVLDHASDEDARYRYAVEVKQGLRRFLSFDPVRGSLDRTFDEDYVLASGAVRVEPRSGDYSLYLLGEYTERDHLFAELYHGLDETAAYRAGTAFAGLRLGDLSVGLTLKHYHLAHRDIGFVREILDPDGEALSPFVSDGDYVGVNADVLYTAGDVYVSFNQRVLVHDPAHRAWSNPVTFGGAAYGRLDWTAAPSMQTIGHYALGLSESLQLDSLRVVYNGWFQAAYAVNATGANSLVFFDGGAKVQANWAAHEWVDLTMSLGKTPVPITSELARLLDPDALAGARTIGDGRLIDTTGGGATSVASAMGQSNIYSLGLGGRFHPFEDWQVNLQAIGKLYHNTYRLDFEGGVMANGYFRDDIYFLGDGPKRYRLHNSGGDLPVYVGGHIQLLGTDDETYVVSMTFSHFNAIGVSPFGNGVTANDIGIVDWSTANPNSARHGLANLDNDRGYTFSFLFGGQLIDRLWAFLTFAHRDGHPFAFYEHFEHDQQVATAYRTPRGSPWVYGPKRTGPREDFQLNVDAEVHYTFEVGGLSWRAGLLVSNLFDFGNELAENMQGSDRSGLEAEIPRSVMLSVELLTR